MLSSLNKEQVPVHLNRLSNLKKLSIFESVSIYTFCYFHYGNLIIFLLVLTRYMPKVKVRKVKSLLSKKSGEEDEQEEEVWPIFYHHSEMKFIRL
jgi:hypothetical protein